MPKTILRPANVEINSHFLLLCYRLLNSAFFINPHNHIFIIHERHTTNLEQQEFSLWIDGGSRVICSLRGNQRRYIKTVSSPIKIYLYIVFGEVACCILIPNQANHVKRFRLIIVHQNCEVRWCLGLGQNLNFQNTVATFVFWETKCAQKLEITLQVIS